jgi:hypothetical protein
MPSCPSSPEPLYKTRTRAISGPPRREKRSCPRRAPRARERTRESERTTRGPRWRGAGQPWRWRRSVSALGVGGSQGTRGSKQPTHAVWRRGGCGFSCAQNKRPACVDFVAMIWALFCRGPAAVSSAAGKGWQGQGQRAALSFWASVRSVRRERDLWS